MKKWKHLLGTITIIVEGFLIVLLNVSGSYDNNLVSI